MTLDLTCPHCGAPNDAAKAPENATLKPQPGDYMVCLECREVSEVSPNGETLSAREIYDLPDEYQPALREVQFLIAQGYDPRHGGH